MKKNIPSQEFRLCSDCNQSKTDDKWCQNCSSKILQQEFGKWTSGNEHVDKFIKDAQLRARNSWEVIEWIPYNRLRNIQYLAEGGFSIVYKAIWLDGYIESWDNENKQWKRYSTSLENEDHENAKNENIKSPLNENDQRGFHVVLKSLNNSANINEEFLNEVNYLYIYSYNLLFINIK